MWWPQAARSRRAGVRSMMTPSRDCRSDGGSGACGWPPGSAKPAAAMVYRACGLQCGANKRKKSRPRAASGARFAATMRGTWASRPGSAAAGGGHVWRRMVIANEVPVLGTCTQKRSRGALGCSEQRRLSLLRGRSVVLFLAWRKNRGSTRMQIMGIAHQDLRAIALGTVSTDWALLMDSGRSTRLNGRDGPATRHWVLPTTTQNGL